MILSLMATVAFAMDLGANPGFEWHPVAPGKFPIHGPYIPPSDIVGGSQTGSSEFPEVVGIGAYTTDGEYITGYYIFCTATVIADQWMATAAHCLEGDGIEWLDQGETYRVWAVFGTRLYEEAHITGFAFADDYAIHPDYTDQTWDRADIAILHFMDWSDTAPNNLHPIPLNSSDMSEWDVQWDAEMVGFGDTYDGEYADPVQRKVTVASGDNWCDNIFGGSYCDGTSNYMFALNDDAPSSNDNTCQGDSGGPVFSAWDDGPHLTGITSYGPACSTGFGYYTRVDPFLDWLDDEDVPYLLAPDDEPEDPEDTEDPEIEDTDTDGGGVVQDTNVGGDDSNASTDTDLGGEDDDLFDVKKCGCSSGGELGGMMASVLAASAVLLRRRR